ncbi:polymer biosynthesis protein, WecB/TagA/CpsF family [Sphingopyxis sp. YR583]|uniref:WecB/TagA/CpsF family glycosyltransferase n=1 Tax=Sphingopyxis sp. YR583 TaxID=1881047 RepID=UPI0008A775D3|nr:WecB/TagA/CpsF family glycosyltransferase [Sphingopyxis sp. YR583]SEH18218.1 polymer biosynthesis protein, WecB/TagA/CpsF family [Sphingopyxis sp. YR583]
MTVVYGPQCEFLGIRFDRLDPPAAAAEVLSLSTRSDFSYVVTPNVDHIVQLSSKDDPVLTMSYRDAALRLCDSRISSRLAYLSGIDLPVVTGSDLTADLLGQWLTREKLVVVGGDAKLHHALRLRYPLFHWQFYQPPMGVRHDAKARMEIAQFVEDAAADVVFFAIGAPQSEIVCAEILARGQARGVALCIGASLEFLTGAKTRAPRWMQRAGLEWLFRLGTEPRRLWRRYLVEGPKIFGIWRRWRKLNAALPRASSGSSVSGCE